jgi:glycine/D-amino acid oxidase-like deaminating enzyme
MLLRHLIAALLTDGSEDPSPPWFAKDVNDFQMLSGTHNIGGKSLTAHKYKSIMINTQIYLKYLLTRASSLGARNIQAALPTSSSFAGTLRYAADAVTYSNSENTNPIDAFVNATGINARKLVPDESVFPVRGQTITVKGEARGITTVDASPDNPTPESPNITYILPRPHSGTTILGGTKQVGNWSGEANEQTTKEILDRARQFAPELLDKHGEFKVLSVQVGLRPGRKGGARVEVEEVGLPGQKTGERFVVCHAYGHAGAGYQNSIGSARKAVRLLEEYFGSASAKAKL